MAKFQSLRRLIGFSCLVLLGLGLSSSAMALDIDVFKVADSDKSKEYLGMLFGTIPGAGLIGASPAFGQVFGIFNGVVLSLTSIVVAYMTIMGVIHTAHEGEIMGKKWSMVMTPSRALLGLYLLIPGSSGYSGIQVFFMWMILSGVGAANSMWEMLINKVRNNESIAMQEDDFNVSASDRAEVSKIFSILICQGFINSNKANSPSFDFRTKADLKSSDEVSTYIYPDTGDAPPKQLVTGIYNDKETGIIRCGVQGVPDYAKALKKLSSKDIRLLLGNASATDQSSIGGNIGSAFTSDGAELGAEIKTLSLHDVAKVGIPTLVPIFNRQMLEGLMQINLLLEPFAQDVAEAISDPRTKDEQISLLADNMMPVFNIAVQKYAQLSTLADPSRFQLDPGTESLVTRAQRYGWMFAGSYFYKLVQAGNDPISKRKRLDPLPPNISTLNTLTDIQGAMPGAGPDAHLIIFDSVFNRTGAFASRLITKNTQGSIKPRKRGGTIQLGKRTVKDSDGTLEPFISFFNGIRDSFLRDTENIMMKNAQNPIVSVAVLGGNIVTILDIAWLTLVAGSIIVMAAAALESCINSAGYAFQGAVKIMVPVISLLYAALYPTALMMALYLPLIPYLIYTFATIGWLFACTEAMIAAPLVAMAIAVPSEDEMGKAGHALLLLTNLFLRPTFIVIGLVAGARLLIVSIELLTLSFRATVSEMVGSSGMFGIVPLLMMYASLITTLANKSFSIIYLLPDHVIRWLGGQADGFGEAEMMQQIKDKGEKTAGAIGSTAGSTAAGTANTASSAIGAARDKKAKGAEGK